MDPLRQLCVWLGVGAGHAALLVALWGSAGAPAEATGDATVTVWLLPLAGDEAPLPAAPRPAPPLAHSIPRPEQVATMSAAAASSPAAHATSPGEPAEAVGAPPFFVRRVEPAYPRGARLAGVQGVVRLGLEVGASGELRRVSVVASSGDDLLDRAAVDAAQASTYGPATVSGRSVDAQVEATYRFELR